MERLRRAAPNIFYLAAVQGANAVLPLVIYPVVLLRLGADSYTQIVQAEVLSMFLLTLVLFSFEVTGVANAVGLNPKTDGERLSRLTSTIVTLRLLLFAIGLPVLLGVTLLIDSRLVSTTFAWSLVPLSFALSPNWLLQAQQDNRTLAIANLVSRTVAVTLILLLVHEPGQLMLVPLLIGISYIIASIATLVLTIRRYGLSLRWVGIPHCWTALLEGRNVFFSNLSAILYRDSYTLMLGVAGASSASIAAFSIAEKLAKAFQALIRPFNQHFFPQAVSLARQSIPRSQILAGIWRLTGVQQLILVGMAVSSLILYLAFGELFLSTVGPPELGEGIVLFFVMTIATLFGVANFMLGTAGLNAMGESKYVLASMLGTGLAGIVLGLTLSFLWQAPGATAAFVLCEILLCALLVRRYTYSGSKANGA